MNSYFGYLIGFTLFFVAACQPGDSVKTGEYDFAHQQSDLTVDEAIEYGRLPNGLRYAVRQNATPSNTATLLMRIDTGSLNEVDGTEGIAHFLEHMAFNGSENIPENEMIKRLERFGLAFGADTNASTSFDETIYQLELPEVNDEIVNETLMILRETADRLLLDPDAIERERGIILAEKRTRNSPAYESFVDSLEFYLGDTRIPKRIPIGTEETIRSVSPEQFRAFYEGYYRPEKTFITFVGDFETGYAIEKIEEYFGDWEASGVAREPLEPGTTAQDGPRTHIYTNAEIETNISLSTMSLPEDVADTAQSRKDSLIEYLGNAILSRRLGKAARTEDAKFISASAFSSEMFDATEISSLSVDTESGSWAEGLAQAEQMLRQALEHGFSQAELDEQIANYQNSLEVSVQTSSTRRTSGLARSINGAFGGESVVVSPQTNLDLFNTNKTDVTLKAVEAAFRKKWAKLDTAPQLELNTNKPVEGGKAAVNAAYAKSLAVPVTPRADEAKQDFAYTDFGKPGKVANQGIIEDIEIKTVVFNNNVRLNIKTTPYEKGRIRIKAILGSGSLTFPSELPGFKSYAPSMISLSGLEAHKIDDIRTIMAGKTVGAAIGISDRRTIITGSTVPANLDEQLNLMTAYAIAPGYRPEAKSQYEKYVQSFYPTLDSTPGGVSSRDVPKILRSGDARYGYPAEADMLAVDFDAIKAWRKAYVDGSAIEISVVGDVDEAAIVKAVGRTFGALPTRAKDFAPIDPSLTQLKFAKGSKAPIKLTHAGDSSTAILQLYWPAPDGRSVETVRKASMLSSLFRLRLTEELRENEGASYSPGAFSYLPRFYPDFGYMGASLELSPDEIDKMSEKVEAIAAEFRRGEFDEALFERAIKPARESIETSLESNSYWMNVIDTAQSDEEPLNRHRSREATYQNITADDLKSLAATLFDPESVVKIQILPEQ